MTGEEEASRKSERGEGASKERFGGGKGPNLVKYRRGSRVGTDRDTGASLTRRRDEGRRGGGGGEPDRRSAEGHRGSQKRRGDPR